MMAQYHSARWTRIRSHCLCGGGGKESKSQCLHQVPTRTLCTLVFVTPSATRQLRLLLVELLYGIFFINIHSLSKIFLINLNRFYVRPRPNVQQNWSFIDHLSRALPTEKIFDLLQKSIRSGSLISHCPAELVFDMQKVIIKWLEVSHRE